MSLIFQKRQLVLPGELLGEGDYSTGENTYRIDKKIYAQRVGLADVDGKTIYIVPLKGPYIPFVDDLVIGQVADVTLNGWLLDIRAPYIGVLTITEVTGRSFNPNMESLTSIYNIGEIIIAKIANFDRTRDPSLTIQGMGLGKVEGGVMVELSPAKIPRLIGRKGSMISMLKQESGADIVAGQNGRVLVRGRNPKQVELLIKAVKMIDREAHTSGLTDRVKAMIAKEKESWNVGTTS